MNKGVITYEGRKLGKPDWERRRLYFLKQRLIGVFLLVCTIIIIKLLDGDATIALFTVPISLILIFSKKKCWTDKYYFDTEEKSL